MNLFAPQWALAAGVFGALGLGLRRRGSSAAIRALAPAVPLCALLLLSRSAPTLSLPLINLDAPGLYWQFVILAASLPMAFLSSGDDVEAALFLGAVLGMSLLASAGNLPMLFIGLEFMSLPAYLLLARAGSGDSSRRLEAAVKYFFAGALAGALFLLGMALYYADTRSLGPTFSSVGAQGQAGLALMAAAALFKLGAVPLHWWLPDVYEAAAPEVAGFLSTAMKAAAVLLLMRVCALAPDAAFARALPMLGGMTALFGSLFALRQKALQRLLAYSSLAHAGFLILGVGAWCALGRDGSSTAALLLYLAAYAFLSNGAFIFLSASGLKTREQLRGYAGGEPVLAAAFAVLLFSLGGVPPTGGFIAKFVIFWQAIRAGFSAPLILAAISSIVSLSYYLALVRDLYFEAPSGAPAQEGRPVARIAVLVCALGALFMGAAPLLLNQLGAGAGR